MAKVRNKHITSNDLQYLRAVEEEYREYGGWDTHIDGDTLTIYAIPRRYINRKSRKQRKKDIARNKRNEKFERRS